MPNVTLYSWGPVQFQVFPLNVGEVDHTTATEWARKEIAGAAVYREWVGENEEEIHLRGKVFPHFYARAARNRIGANTPTGASSGGFGQLDILDNMRRLGQAHTLIRGGTGAVGVHLGWYVMERFSRGHSFLGTDGIGQQVQFEANFQRVPVPYSGSSYYYTVWGAANQ